MCNSKDPLQLFRPCISAHTVWGLCWYNYRSRGITVLCRGAGQLEALGVVTTYFGIVPSTEYDAGAYVMAKI